MTTDPSRVRLVMQVVATARESRGEESSELCGAVYQILKRFAFPTMRLTHWQR